MAPTSAALVHLPAQELHAGCLQLPDGAGEIVDHEADDGTSPITKASGKKKAVLARYARNHRLADALHQQAFCALTASPGARAYYDRLRARGIGHHAALRQLANRLVGILHGCLKTGTTYNEETAWAHHATYQQHAAA